jgi:uncharacterized protein
MQKKSCDIALKDVNTEKGIVEGYFSAFGNVDSDNEMVQKGAFKKSIQERGPSGKARIKHLKNHNPDNLIGKILELKEDETGLYFRSQLSKATMGQDALILYQEGIFTEHSIGYQVLQSKSEEYNSKKVRVLTELKLWEGSAVTWGANENTPITGIKSIHEIEIEIDRLEKALTLGSLSDATIQSLIGQYTKALNFLTQSVKAANQHLDTSEKDAQILLQTFKNTFKNE